METIKPVHHHYLTKMFHSIIFDPWTGLRLILVILYFFSNYDIYIRN